MVNVSAEKVKQATTVPRYSLINIIYVVVAIIIFIVLNTSLLDNVPDVIKVIIYSVLFFFAIHLGNGNIVLLLKQLKAIFEHDDWSIERKLAEAITVTMAASLTTSKFFEIYNDELQKLKGN